MTPQTEQDLSDLIKDARDPLSIRGGGTRSYAHVAGDTVDMRAMSGITLYEPGAMTIVAKAGTPLSEINTALAAENQRLAFEPMDHRALLGTSGEPTIGGVVAANISGPRRISVGACRDFLLGVRFVDGAGNIVKNGGRVMKNVTGYDLVKLMAGAYGTLGVLTEVSLKVLPNVAQTGCVLIHGLDDAQAVVAMSAALGSPFEVTGAAHFPQNMDGDPVTMIRIEGFDASVQYRADRLRDLLKPYGEVTVKIGDADGLLESWDRVRDVHAFAGQPGDIWRISVKPSDAAGLVAKLGAKAVQYDWGGGLIWALTDGGDMRARIGEVKGHATLIRGTAAPVFHPEPAPVAAISAALRAKFDPRNILNTGLMG
ncbi:glycolate oxidase FAD binding subunit [Yoonia tamlensis]|uniref:Glycolate oxidase FAD binding subunit n=1 Tax=Yoonia tamlensis TaxID=390270 RepID=A0A1I6GTC7_9RHOB|nr:FAD-binding protein [Yoonia tamlensis]SFR45428.1 glycolate oxidase FAD binding subunit [Yoonia tamlensis]